MMAADIIAATLLILISVCILLFVLYMTTRKDMLDYKDAYENLYRIYKEHQQSTNKDPSDWWKTGEEYDDTLSES